MILADNGSNFYFQGEANPGWTDDDIDPLKTSPPPPSKSFHVPRRSRTDPRGGRVRHLDLPPPLAVRPRLKSVAGAAWRLRITAFAILICPARRPCVEGGVKATAFRMRSGVNGRRRVRRAAHHVAADEWGEG